MDAFEKWRSKEPLEDEYYSRADMYWYGEQAWKAATERAAGIAEERTYRFCCSGHGVDIAQKIRGKEGGRPVRTIKKNQSVLVARHWE
jgi:hypothetical protein